MVVAGIVRGFSGFGSGMVMVPALAMIYGPVVAVVSIAILEIPASAQLLPGAWRRTDWRKLAPLILSSLVTIPAGTWLLVALDPMVMRRVIALIVLAFVAALATGWRWRGNAGPAALAGLGGLSGVLTGATSMGGPPVILFFLAGAHGAGEVRASLIVFLMAGTLAALGLYAWHGVVTAELVLRIALLAPFHLAALWAGGRLFHAAPEALFRRIALVVLAAIATAALLT